MDILQCSRPQAPEPLRLLGVSRCIEVSDTVKPDDTIAVTPSHTVEVARGERFEFGENWRRFLEHLTAERIAAAEQSLRTMLEVPDLGGRTFLDIGSGSGLFSLAARHLGARVFSFDYDPRSVACTLELRRRYFDSDPHWRVEEGSALDREYIASLGQFDVVYSWGVLHHTGEMWKALENATVLVRPGGLLFIALYNSQGGTSRRWKAVKQAYNRFPLLRGPLLMLSFLGLHGTALVRGVLGGRPLQMFEMDKSRGMSLWRDLVDWVGGYPFEVADPGEVFEFFSKRGFHLTRLKTTHSLGCNEFVFKCDPRS
jgi:2-polyprenyl-3-methyl-5-hydroxy-6-metoxy-1,4-benzoquinol methylase